MKTQETTQSEEKKVITLNSFSSYKDSLKNSLYRNKIQMLPKVKQEVNRDIQRAKEEYKKAIARAKEKLNEAKQNINEIKAKLQNTQEAYNEDISRKRNLWEKEYTIRIETEEEYEAEQDRKKAERDKWFKDRGYQI